jgi:hypothetical protein
MHAQITWSSAFFTHALSGTKPSCVACWRKVSPVARFIWLTSGETGTDKVQQMKLSDGRRGY